MKKILFFILLFINSLKLFAQQEKKIYFNDVICSIFNSENNSLEIKLNEKNGEFKNVFVLLLKDKLNKNLFSESNKFESNIIYEKASLTLEIKNGRRIKFITNSALRKNISDNDFSITEVYGISRYKGDFSSDKNLIYNPYIGDIISTDPNSLLLRDFRCDSGGAGSSQCGVSTEILGIATQCEVACNTGFYACCDDGIGKCKCFKNGTKPKDLDTTGRNNASLKNITKTSLYIDGNYIRIKNPIIGSSLIIYDANGIIKINETIKLYNSLDISKLSKNIYFYNIIKNDEIIKQGKIIL